MLLFLCRFPLAIGLVRCICFLFRCSLVVEFHIVVLWLVVFFGFNLLISGLLTSSGCSRLLTSCVVVITDCCSIRLFISCVVAITACGALEDK